MSLLRKLLPRTYMARRNLVRAKARSGLAVLTILIGVMAIASLGSFGAAFETAQRDAVGGIGNEVMVMPGEDAEFLLDERDRRAVESVAAGYDVVPVLRGRWEYGDGGNVIVHGVGNPQTMFEVQEGSIPPNWRSGALVGADFAEEEDLEPGQSVRLEGQNYRVLAVLEPEGQGSMINPNDGVVLPPDEMGVDGYSRLLIETEDASAAAELSTAIEAELNGREERVAVQDFSDIAEEVDQVFFYINVFLIGVGAISLLVAGISIANVMLMSAIERREEIGVLRAVGYRQVDVMGIMLSEAMLLGVIGAIAGVALALLITMGINSVMLDDPYAFQPATLDYSLLAFGFGVGASILAGLYPAWKAARKPPVEALRS